MNRVADAPQAGWGRLADELGSVLHMQHMLGSQILHESHDGRDRLLELARAQP